jgi:hypothetical protein
MQAGRGEILERIPEEEVNERGYDAVMGPLVDKWSRIIRARRFGQILRGEEPT